MFSWVFTIDLLPEVEGARPRSSAIVTNGIQGSGLQKLVVGADLRLRALVVDLETSDIQGDQMPLALARPVDEEEDLEARKKIEPNTPKYIASETTLLITNAGRR